MTSVASTKLLGVQMQYPSFRRKPESSIFSVS